MKIYEKYHAENKDRDDRPVLIEPYDYIKNPKPDGYRGVHLVYKYQSRHTEKQPLRGQRIEIQIRSKLQHAWATAVETSQAFTGQALKAKIKTASSPEWLRFFALMGSAIAARERRPIVPGTPNDKTERSEELRAIAQREGIVVHLEGWSATMHRLEERKLSGAHTFLLRLDTANRTLSITPFKADELLAAQARYLELEKETEGNPQIQLVLVRVDSVDALRSAYPNYYVDSSAFIEAVRREIS